MVQAILEGRKTQTRRIIKGMPDNAAFIWHDGAEWIVEDYEMNCWNGKIKCPYGKPGDVLWVREAFNYVGTYPEPDIFGLYLYKANGDAGPMRPSIHMPKDASRIWLRIKDVRVERVHDITDNDVYAEGVLIPVDSKGHVLYEISRENSALSFVKKGSMIDQAFWAQLWCDIHSRESWDANPWVWVIEFERCEAPITHHQ